MPLRRATYADLSQVSTLLSKAFYNDPLNEYFFPNREKYPDDYLRDFTHDVMISWWNYNVLWIVSYDDAGVNGVICWTRKGTPVTPLWDTPWWDPRRVLARLAIATHERQRRTFNNRAARAPSDSDPDPIRKHNFGATMAPFRGTWFDEPELSSNHWVICLLAVDPDHQRRGIGAELVSWGVAKAKDENVPCIVISSTGSEKFYQKQGLEVYVGCAGTVDRVVDGIVVENPMKHRVTSGGHIYKTRV